MRKVFRVGLGERSGEGEDERRCKDDYILTKVHTEYERTWAESTEYVGTLLGESPSECGRAGRHVAMYELRFVPREIPPMRTPKIRQAKRQATQRHIRLAFAKLHKWPCSFTIQITFHTVVFAHYFSSTDAMGSATNSSDSARDDPPISRTVIRGKCFNFANT